MSAMRLDSRSGIGRWAIAGLVNGLIAGVVFIVFEIILAGITGPSAIMPLRAISAIVLGMGALTPSVGVATAVIVGLIVHFILAAIFGLIFGIIFGALSSVVRALGENRSLLILAATIGGFILWLVNFYLIAPAAFPWFTMTNPVVQFFAHTFFYGTALGLLLAGRLRGGREA